MILHSASTSRPYITANICCVKDNDNLSVIFHYLRWFDNFILILPDFFYFMKQPYLKSKWMGSDEFVLIYELDFKNLVLLLY